MVLKTPLSDIKEISNLSGPYEDSTTSEGRSSVVIDRLSIGQALSHL